MLPLRDAQPVREPRLELHTQTTIFMVCVVYLTMHAVIWLALSEQRDAQVWLWSVSGLMSGLGVIALATRGTVSEFVFVHIGQALMVFGNAGRSLALRMFFPSVSRKPILFYAISSLLLLAVLGVGHEMDVPEYYLRLVYFSFYALILVDYFLLGRRLGREQQSFGAALLMGAGIGLSATHWFKVGWLLTQPYAEDIYAPSLDQYVLVLGQFICIPLANIGFLRVFLEERERQRLRAERELAAAEASRRMLARHHEELTVLLHEREEIIRRLTLSSKTAAMGALVASLAHELNQPLCSTGLNLSLLERKLRDDASEPDGLQELLASIKSDNRRAADIILKLRMLFEQGEGVKETVDIRELVEDCVALLSVRARADGVRIDTSVPENVLLAADRTQLQQVLLNLISNAIDALRESGKEDKWVRLSAHSRATELIVTVEDNGTGIPPDQQAFVFDLFKTSKSEGMGIGLWLSQTVVNAHGGTISVSGKAGEGARFEVVLPVMNQL